VLRPIGKVNGEAQYNYTMSK